MRLLVSEYKWQDEIYHTVQPYQIPEPYSNMWKDMFNWCEEKFGTAGDPWANETARWYANSGKFWFKNDDDHILFLLRWS